MSTKLYSNSVELLIFSKSQNVTANGYYGIATLYHLFTSCECLFIDVVKSYW